MDAVLKNAQAGDFVNLNWFSFGDGSGGSADPGWVLVDAAEWNAQLAEFRAMAPRPVPANTVRVPEFHASCGYSHSKPDDPIVFPGLPGASHMHSFLGNDSTDAKTTTDTLLSTPSTTDRG